MKLFHNKRVVGSMGRINIEEIDWQHTQYKKEGLGLGTV